MNTPELDVEDNDYAAGLLVQKTANSRYKDDRLIIVIRRRLTGRRRPRGCASHTVFVAGPVVKRGAVVSKRYTTVSMIRTIVDELGKAVVPDVLLTKLA